MIHAYVYVGAQGMGGGHNTRIETAVLQFFLFRFRFFFCNASSSSQGGFSAHFAQCSYARLYPKIVIMKNAYLRIAIFKISRGSMPPDPLEEARASPRRDRYAITSFGVLKFHAPPPPPRDSNPGSATDCNTFSIFC